MISYLSIAKTLDDQIVYGIASTDIVDDQPGEWDGQRYEGDLVDPAAMTSAIDDYWGNIRAMHDEAVGTALDVRVEDGTTYLVAKVVDADAWTKVKTGVYRGFSIGGRVLKAHLETIGGRIVRVIDALMLTEISLVDRPANPHAAILLFKRKDTLVPPNDDDALVVEKAADTTKVVQMIQAIRNDMELSGDLEGAERMTQAIGLLLVGDGVAEEEVEEEEAEEEETEEAEVEEAEVEEAAPLALKATAPLQKAGRKISASRMTIMKQAVMAYLKVLADAGDPDSTRMLKAMGGDEALDTKSLVAEIRKAIPIETMTKALTAIDERVKHLEAQPVAGGPVRNFAAPVSKSLTQQRGTPPPDPAAIADARRRYLMEANPALKAQYEAELKALGG